MFKNKVMIMHMINAYLFIFNSICIDLQWKVASSIKK